MRERGLEPLFREELDPKSSASANSATLAAAYCYLAPMGDTLMNPANQRKRKK